MRHTTAMTMFFACLIGVALTPRVGLGDTPLPPPSKLTFWSPNRQFYAISDPNRKVTTVYRTSAAGPGTKVWSMIGWYRVASLADDGTHMVVGYDGMNLVPTNVRPDQVMLDFVRKGELVGEVTLGELIGDPATLPKTASHRFWGNVLGIDKQGRYVVKTARSEQILLDVATGKILMRAPVQGAIPSPGSPR